MKKKTTKKKRKSPAGDYFWGSLDDAFYAAIEADIKAGRLLVPKKPKKRKKR